MSSRSSLPRHLVALACALALAVLATSARAGDDDATGRLTSNREFDQAMERLPWQIRVHFRGRTGQPARRALRRVLAHEGIDQGEVLKMLSQPAMSPYAGDTILAIDQLADVPGVDRLVHRLSKESTDRRISGPALELQSLVHLKPRLRELSADVGGHEVDGVLDDGTLVEVKYIRQVDAKLAPMLIDRAISQLELRGSGHRPTMLIVNKELEPHQLRAVDQRLGGQGTVMVGGRNGLRWQHGRRLPKRQRSSLRLRGLDRKTSGAQQQRLRKRLPGAVGQPKYGLKGQPRRPTKSARRTRSRGKKVK